MSYNKENYIRLKKQFEERSAAAEQAAETRRAELHAAIPELKGMDDALSEIGLRMFRLAMELSGEELEEAIKKLECETEQLAADRAALIEAHGYPSDYDKIKYECRTCMDTGFVGTKMCSCFRRALVLAGYESSGIAGLIRTQTFETFDPACQRADPKSYELMKLNLSFCKNYAETFDPATSCNLLLIGATGLGKTHLSTAIAKVVIDRGFDVVYDTAQNVLADFEYERFGRGYGIGDESEPPRTAKYFECELLIVDDLGTELSNQFTVSCLYNIINTRVNKHLPTIINTNLGRDELRRRYADRITSRLFGEFRPLLFTGTDVRTLKLSSHP